MKVFTLALGAALLLTQTALGSTIVYDASLDRRGVR
jgi:hypothetical protein